MSKLIGTNPNQVPSNADLGTAAFMDKKEFLLSKGSEMSAINAVIPKTAVDVFIYDTTKDSDGGAWRKRTQHTSWYNERLNTATRGSRREFPAVAVIVATANSIIIYDGDDVSLPMWMVFQPNGILDWPTTTHVRQYVAAVNGQIVTVSEDGGLIFRYIDDYTEVIYGSLYYPITSSRIIADRNKTSAYAVVAGGATRTYVVLTWVMNDVAITVLPNAPIDPATGLPTPTIAVATNAGVSIIKDNGSVVDITVNNVYYTYARRVNFLSDNSLGMGIGVENGVAQESYYIFNNIPTSDNVITVDNITGTTQNVDEFYAIQAVNPAVDLQLLGLNTNRALRSSTGNSFASDEGLSVVSRNVGAPDRGMVAYITSNYNTGWMPGDIKGAWLSDTSTVTASSTGILAEDFSAQGDWGFADGPTISGGVLTLANQTSSRATLSSWNGISGKRYLGIVDISSNASSGTFALDDDGSGAGVGSTTNYRTFSGTGIIYFYFTKTNSDRFRFIRNGGGPISITSFYVYELEEDRSVNNNGLQTFGNIIKTPVATGADLVAYSGFSASNYLQQPYNSALAAGTGTQTFIAWFRFDSTPSTKYLIHRGIDDGNESLRIAVTTSDIYFDYGGGSDYAQASFVPSIGVWTCIVATVTAGQFGKIYLNGKLQVNNTQFVAPSTFLDASTYVTTIGGSHTYGLWFNGSIALARYSLSTISDQQVLKLYEDEKMLFQENSKATLYGASNAVTALAYDDDTNLLHVGTSSGRSDFQGLRRINNTTSAIGTAISAVDGFIVEE